ncbi:hypothetical protein GCM10011273_03100 [Asticcacaulis endophyticus]|uniref:Uncharacterized protein n=1 Tax=Asticcacaulis endophyticus TaxID=1395890 RepID=A0A918UMX5_9CAUL|nr:hypothetical protein GCM10011273_03100 [Asticcacaulis endophyticus]
MPPPVMAGGHSILKAFWELSTERQIGFGVGPIPGSLISKAASDIGIYDPDRVADFRSIIRACDEVYLSRSTPKDPNDKSAAAAKPAMAMDAFDTMLERGRNK